MLYYKTRVVLWMLGVIFITTSCYEEISFSTETLENTLVVEATITNELKKQEINLSRATSFQAIDARTESNALVVIEGANKSFSFFEQSPGNYLSDLPFAAQAGVEYILTIVTQNGETYQSLPSKFIGTSVVSLSAERATDSSNGDGMSLYVNSYDATGKSRYYRYEYEETYKIIAPKWVSEDMIIIGDLYPNCEVALVPKTEEKRVCYGTTISNKIIQETTQNLSEDRISRFLVRQISKENYILTHRYSILVKQYIQSPEAYTYFNLLKSFSSSDDIFFSNQPGFFEGNINSLTTPNQKTVGFFNVCSVSEQRIFFNYEDFFPNEPRPGFIDSCIELSPKLQPRNVEQTETFPCGPLIEELQENRLVYLAENEIIEPFSGPFIMVPTACGDCTALGVNVIPDFWEE